MSKENDLTFTEKRFSSKSWKNFEDKQTKFLFDNYLNLGEFLESDEENLNKINKKQENNIKMNKLFSDSFINLKKSSMINGWNYRRNKNIEDRKNYLSFLYVVNYYFMFELKKKESNWSWILIIISTICSILSVINSNIIWLQLIKTYLLTILSVITSLIAAYMKKENYVDRIKDMDRYIQKVGKIKTELNIILTEKPWNRITYDNFKEKYEEEIINLFSYPPPISPKEFKLAVYKITRYHSELINDTYPWYSLEKVGDIEVYKMTPWGRQIVYSYHNYKYDNKCKKILNCICDIPKTKFNDYKKYNKVLFNDKKIETLQKIDEIKDYTDIKNNIPIEIKNEIVFEGFTDNEKDDKNNVVLKKLEKDIENNNDTKEINIENNNDTKEINIELIKKNDD